MNMQKYIFKTIAIQLGITLIWLTIASYEFVKSDNGDPLQIGIIEWLLMIAQFVITGIVGLILIANAKDKKFARKKLLVSLLIVFLILSLSLLFDDLLWKWLWSLRKGVIQ